MGLLSETGAGRGGMHPDAQIMLVLDSAGSYSISETVTKANSRLPRLPPPPPPQLPGCCLIVSPFLNDLITSALFN